MSIGLSIRVFDYLRMDGWQQQSSRPGVPPSPAAGHEQPFLAISVTDPVKLGTGVQAYISYRVSTKVRFLPSLSRCLPLLVEVCILVRLCNMRALTVNVRGNSNMFSTRDH